MAAAVDLYYEKYYLDPSFPGSTLRRRLQIGIGVMDFAGVVNVAASTLGSRRATDRIDPVAEAYFDCLDQK